MMAVLMKTVKSSLIRHPLERESQLWHTIPKYQNVVAARRIAVLTEEMKEKAELIGGLKSIDSLPGPRVFPILGNLNYFKNRGLNIHLTQLRDAKKYGAMYKDKILKARLIVIQDPDICKEIYRAEGKFPYRDFSSSFGVIIEENRKAELPKSFIELNGEEWAELRRKFQKKMLAPMNVKPFYPLFSDVAVDAVEHLRSLRDENSIINDVCEEVVGRWALESIGKFVYGIRTGYLDATLTEENRKSYEGIKIVMRNSLALSQTKWLKHINRKAYADFKQGLKEWRIVARKRMETVVGLVRNVQKMGETLDDDIANSLLCDLLLTKNMDIVECGVHASGIYGAGFDTTSATTAWVLYWLGMNPDKQEILYKEVIDRIPKDGRITDAAVQQMPYLRACIKESARLTPLTFINVRVFSEDMVLRGYIIPARTPLFLSNYNMGRDESIYPNANSFLPERWLRENKKEVEIHPFSSLPFGVGVRSCLGRRIVDAEMQVFIAQMVRRLKIKYICGEQDGVNKFGLKLPKSTFAFYDR